MRALQSKGLRAIHRGHSEDTRGHSSQEQTDVTTHTRMRRPWAGLGRVWQNADVTTLLRMP